MRIRLPHNGWTPRAYQMDFWQYMINGGKRAVLRFHRRAGKDAMSMHWTAYAMMLKPGNYWHLLPEANQARKALWLGVNPHTGVRIIDEVFPKELRKRTVDNEMIIELINGSIWQVIGSDRYDSLVGSPPAGIVFSEYALSNPSAWDMTRPMLLENGGWAIFNSTVRGKNHFWDLGEYARGQNDWFFQQLDADRSGVFTEEQLAGELRELQATRGVAEGTAIYRQEYMNDPNAAIPGAYYGEWLTRASDEGRICKLPHNPMLPVYTSWDIGISDNTDIWFVQAAGREFHVLEHYGDNNKSASHYAKIILDKPYTYANHILPHDAGTREKGSGKTYQEYLSDAGLFKTTLAPKLSVQFGIDSVRSILDRCYFDSDKCRNGLMALQAYRKEYDDRLKTFKDNPLHDWSSHASDAFRYFAVGYRPHVDTSHLPQSADMDYDSFAS